MQMEGQCQINMDTLNQKPHKTFLDNLFEFENYIGKEVGLTSWVEMPQEKINSFAEVTEDMQWIHIDSKRAEIESPYKKTVAHGFLMLSMISKIIFDVCHFSDVKIGINYGLDRVRFPSATKSGDFYRARVTLVEFQKIKMGAKYKLKIVFELKNQDKPACIAEVLFLAYNS